MGMITAIISPIITIWIHGTRPTECVPLFLKETVCGIEKVLFIDQQTTGLVHVSRVNNREYIVELAKNYCQKRQCQQEDFYFFAWSGKLNPQARKEASTQLYNEVRNLAKMYQERCGVRPRIEIISHSHGGNVALLMAEIYSFAADDLVIDRLILLGCPVQKITKALISSPLFKKVYNIHSHSDWMQVLDPQGIHLFKQREEGSDLFDILNNFFSARHFDLTCDNLTQIHVRWDILADQHDEKRILFPIWLQKRLEYANKLRMKRGLFHIEFTLNPFARQLPHIIEIIETDGAGLDRKKEIEIKIL